MKPTSPTVVRGSRSRFRSLLIEQLESRRVLASDWRNPIDSLDVDGDGSISPLDPLVIINRINEGRDAGLPAIRPASEKFIDVDGDQTVSPLDVLVLINHINAVGPGVRTLTEQSSSVVTELPIVVTLGQSTGTRKLQFQITPRFDNSDQLSALGDTFAAYLVDPKNPSQTLLSDGESGSPFFQLSGTRAIYTPGIVQWDGSLLTVDVSTIKNFDTGLLKLQLINADKDLQSSVAVQPVFNRTNASELPPSIANISLAKATPGVAVNVTNYAATSTVSAVFDRVRYDRSANRLDTEAYLVNNGAALGRDAIVVLAGLPASVVLQNKSGTTAAGLPYINFRDAIGSGGLGAQRTSARIPLVFLNPQGQPFSFSASVLAGPPNRAPTISPISPLTISPGGYVAIDIPASDLDSDSLTYSISAAGNGSLLTSDLNPDGTLVLQPTPEELGTYSIDITASDGMLQATRTVTINVVPDPITTTRTSGKILNLDGTPLVGVRVEVGNVQALTLADGSFLLDLGAGTPASETIRVRGELISGANKYPFIAEKLPFVLGHPIYNGYRNVIGRPIYLPTLNAGTTIQATQNTTVTQQLRPQEAPARVDVSANTLQNQQGIPFTGQLSITEVPPSFTPVSLPPNIAPDSVVTIQPGEMTFSRPTPLSLPNRAGWPPGTIMDLWSINPVTGQFDIVGTSRVSTDGKSIDTIEGGIRTSSWHMVSPPPPPENLVKGLTNDRNLDIGCQSCEFKKPVTSEVSLFTGGVTETHALVSYSSLGADRSVVFMYDSLRADPRPIIHGGLFDAGPNTDIVMSVSVQRDGTLVKMPGFVPESDSPNRNFPELRGGEHFFQSPNQQGEAGYSLQLDLRDFPTGRYRYETATGLSQTWTQTTTNGDIDRISYSTRTDSDYLVHVNTINSPFGAGWGVAGLQQFFLNDDGSALLVDGDGSELLFPTSPTSNNEWLSPAGDFSKLVRRNDGTLIRTMKDQTRYEFDSQNRIANVTDRNGNQTQFQYSGTTGYLTSITDPVGLVTAFAYTNNKISSITDPASRVTRFSHDAAGNLTQVTDPDNSSRVWRYDDGHHMTGETDQLGNVESAFYDSAGRVTEATLKDGAKIYVSPVQTQGLPESSSIDPRNPARAKALGAVSSTYVDSRGFSSSTSLDRAGQMSGGQDGQGNLAGVTRNGFNLVTSTQSPRGNRTQLRYDDQGNVIQASDSLTPSGTGLYEGTIDFSRQENYHFLSITSTTLVNFDRVSQDADLVLLHGDTEVIWNGGSDGSVLLYPGEYKLKATRATPGPYSFRLRSLAEATEIAAGSSQQLSFNSYGESIAFRINANAFDRIAFTPLSNSNVIQWKLIGPQATNSFFATANTVQSPTLPASDAYTLVIWRIDTQENPLNFGFRTENLGNFPLAPATGQVINLGQSVTGSIDTASEIDRYKFSLSSPKRVYLDQQTNGAFTYSLTGPVSIANFDESNAPTILLPGEYQLSVASSATGSYRFTLLDLATAQSIVPSTNLDGTLNPSNSTLAYRFTANEGDRYYLNVVSNQSIASGRARLIDPTGSTVWSINSLSDQEFTTNWKGEYLFLVEGAINESPEVDTFRIRLLKPTVRSQSHVFSQLTSGSITTIGDSQEYTFSLDTSTLLYYDDIGVNSLFPTLWDSNGQVSSGWSSGSASLAPGNYRLVFDPSGADFGDYSFRLSKLSDAPVLSVGTSTSGILNPYNSSNLYRFAANAGDRFFFDVLDDNDITYGYWSLLDADGHRVFSQPFSDSAPTTMPRTGQYYLLVEGANNEPSNGADSFRFNIESRGTETAPSVVGTSKAFGALVTGEITSAAEKHYYKFSLPNESSVFLDSHTLTGSYQWTISSATELIGSSSFTQDSGIINLPSGDYQVSVESSDPAGTYEFRFFDLATASPLILGAPVSGILNPSNEADLYRFTANAGERYFFDVLEDRDINLGGWRLIAPDGSQVWAQSFADRETESIKVSGAYTLIVEGRNDEGGDPDSYRFNVEPQGTTLTPQLSGIVKSFGSLVTSELTSANEKHYYKFSLPSDGSVFLDSESYTGDFDWNLTSTTGQVTAGSFFSDSGIIALKAGDYQVSVESNGPVGVYAFRFHSLNAATVLTPGTPVSGSLNPSNQSDVYRFNASAGETYLFDVLEDRDISLGSWRLIRPDGVQAWAQSFSDRQPELLTLTGQYSLIVDGRNDEGGDPDVYRINVEPRGTITNPAVLGAVTTLGALVTGELTAASEKIYYKYILANDSQVYFDSHSFTGALDWAISSADRLIESGSFFSDSGIQNLPAGEYQVSVESNGTTGPFEFRLNSLSNATQLIPGIPFSGSLNPSNESDLYRFNATAGDMVKFDVLEDRDIALGSWRLIAPNGEQVWNQPFISRDVEILERTGQYTLIIDGRNDEESSPDFYRINVEPRGTVATPQVTGTAIAFGSTITGQINNANEKLYYKFSAPSSGLYMLDSLTPVINLTWEINSATQSLQSRMIYENSSVLQLEAGDYQIAVRSFGATGEFSFRMLNLADGSIFTPGNTISGAINPVLKADTYRFSANVGDRFSFDTFTQPSNLSYWQLVTPSGRTLWDQSYSDRSTETLLETGTYNLVLYGDLTSSGNYSFQVVPQGNQPPVGFTGDFIVPGQLVTGELTATTNQISYRLDVSTESFVFFDGKVGASLSATINDSYGFVAQASPLTTNAGPIQLRPGAYQILVEGFGNVGPFSFRLLDNPTATPVVLGELTTATLNQFDSVAYRFTANAGDRIAYNFHSIEVNNGSDTLQLVDQLGNVIWSGPANIDVDPVSLPRSGAYTLVLSSTNANGGPGKIQFTLENRGSFATPTFAGTPIALGQVQTGTFTETVRGLLYKFSLPAASTIFVDTYSSINSIYWSVYDSNHQTATNNMDSNFIRLEAGEYQIGFEDNSLVNSTFDFRVVDFSTATSIVPNAQTTVTLGLQEAKVFQFNANAGDRFNLSTHQYENFSNGNTIFQLVGPDGEFVAAPLIGGSPMAPLNRTGRYNLVIARSETNGGLAKLSFTLESLGTVASPGVVGNLIPFGQSQQGELTESVRGVYYKFTASTATNIMVDILSAGNIEWTLTGRNGVVTASNGGDSGIIGVAPGDYQLLFNSLNNALGVFSFQVVDLGSSASVTLGNITTATLGVRESKAYRFNATAGDQLALDIISTENFSNGTNNYQLIDPNGESVFFGQISSGTAPVTLKHSGNYSLLLTRNDTSGVAAKVVFNLQPSGTLQTPTFIGTQITTGQVIQGELADTAKAIYYKFTLASDTRILVDTLTGNPNIRWTLNGPRGSVTSSVGDSDIQPLAAGNYQIAYETFDNQYGPFSFQLIDLATTTAIVPNTITSIDLALRESKAYRFDATVGDRIALSLFTTSSFSNSYLQVFDPQGASVWSNTIGTNIPPMTLNKTGVYSLVVSRNDSSGVSARLAFELEKLGTLNAPQFPGEVIAIGQAQQGELSATTPALYYKFILPTSTSIVVDKLNESSNIGWVLRDAKGAITSSNGDVSDIDLAAGEYSIVFSASNLSSTASFSFKILADSLAEVVTTNTTVTSQFGVRESKAFRFSANAGERYFFDIVSAVGVNPFGGAAWTLKAPNGDTLWQAQLVDRTPIVLNSTGNYTLRIDRFDSGSTAPISFEVESAPSAILGTLRLDGSGGKRMTYDDSFNMLTRTVDERGMVTSIDVHPSNGNTQSVTIADGTRIAATSTLAYNTRGQVTSMTDALGRVTEMEYSALGRVVRQTRAKGTTLEQTDRFEYDTAGNLTAFVDALGRRTETTFDSMGRPLSVKDPLGRVTQFRFDARSNLLSTTDPLGRTTTSLYDSRDRVVKTVFVDGNDVEYRYDSDGNLVSMTDERGNTTRTNFDSRGRPESIVQADGSVYSTVYDADNNPTQTFDALGRVTRFEYDLRGQNTRMVNALGQETTKTFDANGNVLSIVDRGVRTSFEYDLRNRMIARLDADPDGAGPLTSPRTQYVYDAIGNVTQTIDPLGRVTRMEYDALNRVIRTIDPRNAETRYEYDAVGNTTAVIDSVGNRTSFLFDALNRVIEETDPTGAKKLFEYDAVGNLVKRTDRNGRVTAFDYDNRNRLLHETWVGGSNVIEYNYEPDGTLSFIADDASALDFTFDSLNRIDTVEDSIGVHFQYSFDANGNTTAVRQDISNFSTSTPVTTNTTYSYDALNRMQSVAQTGTGISSKRAEFAYTNNGMLASISRFSGASGGTALSRSEWTYDGLRRLDGIAHKNGAGTTISSFDFDFDVASQLTKQTNSRGVVDYGYDAASQVTSATYSDAAFADETYAFDANGNRTSTHVAATGHQTGTANRLQSDGKYNYAYDAEGNLIRRTTIVGGAIREFTWDYRNRLTAVIDKNAAGVATKSSRYTYDAMNRRITESVDETPNDTVDAAIVHFVYDREDIVTELIDADGKGPQKPTVRTQYMHGPGIDQVLARETSGATEWLLTDHLGSTVLIVNSSGAQVASANYDSFGNTIASTGTIGRFGYTGRELDASTGLYYYRARYYDPAMGRFVSEDPIGFAAGDTNLQRYVGNESIVSTDPTGTLQNTQSGILLNYQTFRSQSSMYGDGAKEALKLVKHGLNMKMGEPLIRDYEYEKAQLAPGSSVEATVIFDCLDGGYCSYVGLFRKDMDYITSSPPRGIFGNPIYIKFRRMEGEKYSDYWKRMDILHKNADGDFITGRHLIDITIEKEDPTPIEQCTLSDPMGITQGIRPIRL